MPDDTRPAVGNGRLLAEGALILTPLATIIGWLVTLLPVHVPVPVQSAIAALVVALGGVIFSALRDRGFARVNPLVPVALLAIVLGTSGCVHWNGAAYTKLAGDEIVALTKAPVDVKISPDTCTALQLGAEALRDESGGSKSLNAPFFSGQHISALADSHERSSSVCSELETRDASRGVTPALRQRNRDAWRKTWTNGRALAGKAPE